MRKEEILKKYPRNQNLLEMGKGEYITVESAQKAMEEFSQQSNKELIADNSEKSERIKGLEYALLQSESKIKELEFDLEIQKKKTLINYQDVTRLESQLKEADSKAVNFAEWLGKNCTRMTTATYWVYNGQNYYSAKELFEIFEQENK